MAQSMVKDMLSEATGSRVLTTRHIPLEKAPAMNDAINTTVVCHNLVLMPDFYTYYNAIEPFAWALWSCGVLAVLALCALFAATLRAARRQQPWAAGLASLPVVLAVYPLVGLSCLVVLVAPRARLLAEAAAQQAVMLAMYHFFCLLVAEAGGEDKLVSAGYLPFGNSVAATLDFNMAYDRGSRLESRVLPCCCWPCCVIPRPILDKQALSWLRCAVLQLPVAQGLVYCAILVLWAEDLMLYMRTFVFFQPFVIGSILAGVWGVIMLVRTLEATGIFCRPRFLAVQLALVVVKAQCGVAKVLPELFQLPCLLRLNPAVVVHMIQYSIMMLEMVALSAWARRLYGAAPALPLKPAQARVAVAALEANYKASAGV